MPCPHMNPHYPWLRVMCEWWLLPDGWCWWPSADEYWWLWLMPDDSDSLVVADAGSLCWRLWLTMTDADTLLMAARIMVTDAADDRKWLPATDAEWFCVDDDDSMCCWLWRTVGHWWVMTHCVADDAVWLMMMSRRHTHTHYGTILDADDAMHVRLLMPHLCADYYST